MTGEAPSDVFIIPKSANLPRWPATISFVDITGKPAMDIRVSDHGTVELEGHGKMEHSAELFFSAMRDMEKQWRLSLEKGEEFWRNHDQASL